MMKYDYTSYEFAGSKHKLITVLFFHKEVTKKHNSYGILIFYSFLCSLHVIVAFINTVTGFILF